MRFVAAVARGQALPATSGMLGVALGTRAIGFPPPRPAPIRYRERLWLEDALMPAPAPLALRRVPGGVLRIRPAPDGAVAVTVEGSDGRAREPLRDRWEGEGWERAGP